MTRVLHGAPGQTFIPSGYPVPTYDEWAGRAFADHVRSKPPNEPCAPTRPAHQPGDTWNPHQHRWVRDPWPDGCPVAGPLEGIHHCDKDTP